MGESSKLTVEQMENIIKAVTINNDQKIQWDKTYLKYAGEFGLVVTEVDNTITIRTVMKK